MAARPQPWFLSLLLCTAGAGAVCGQSERVSMRDISSRVRITAKLMAEESDLIHNPLDRPQVVEAVEDGSWVEAGARIVLFDATLASNEWVRLTHRKRVSDAELEMRLTDQDNRLSELSDKLQAAHDRLAVDEARLEALLSEPDTNAVRVAEGRIRVQRLSCEAASNEWVRARQRLDAGLISPAAYEKHASAYAQAQARATHALEQGRLTDRPADPLEIEQRQLAIGNLRMDLTNLVVQIEDTLKIVELQKDAARMRARSLDRQIREQEEALENVRVTAPRAGFVSYVRDFVRRYSSGTERMWRKYVFARMPNPQTLVIRGPIKESQRRFFNPGDPVEIRIIGRMGEPIAGRITAISTQARDSAEREEAGWGGPAEYGVKVYDVTVKPDEQQPWMRLEMHAECELRAAQPIQAPAVPAEYLINREGQSLLIVDGQLRPVSGTVAEGLFVLTDTNLVGTTVSLRLPQRRDEPEADELSSVLFETSGELIPSDTTDVIVRTIYGWQKIAWIIPENSVVTAGTVVATLDGKETRDQLTEAEQRLQEATSSREAQEQSRVVLLRQNMARLATESNHVRIAEIALDLARQGANQGALADARLQVQLADITAADRKRDHDAIAKRPAELTSTKERTRAERAWEKAALSAEQSRLKLSTLEAMPDGLELARLTLALEEARMKWSAALRQSQTDDFASQIDLHRSIRHETWRKRYCERATQWLDNLQLYAPRAGIVRYRRIWSNNTFSKVAAGSMVATGFTPVMIANLDRMEIRAEVPERFYTAVTAGRRVLIQIPSISDALYSGTVTSLEYLFEERKQKSVERGLYSGHETLGETVFFMRVSVDPDETVPLQAGAAARIVVPKQTSEAP